jgi:hypothetical protein
MRINAPDFQPARMEKKVRVRPDRDSERQSFLLTPQRTGVLRIEFDVLIDDLTVASQVLKTQSEASDRLTAPATPVVVSVPLSVVVRPRRRRAWILAVAAGVLFATVIAYLLFPHLLFHRPAHGVPLVDAGRGFPKISPAQSAVTLSLPVPHNYALIFATNDYASWPHLTNPIPDADALNQTLKTLYNFQVDELRNPTNEEILAKLTDYLHRTFQPQDQLLVFFSGHGYFDNDLGQGFIVPSNAPPLQNDLGHTKLLAHDTIMRYVNRIPSQHVVLIIDACFAGTLDRKIADSGLRGDSSLDIYAHASLPELLVRKEPKRTRRYFASGGKDFVPDGAPGHHSPFLAALLVTLNQAADRKGYATLDDIQLGLNTVNPEPRWGDIQDENDPGADFILLTPNAVNQLTRPN